MTYDGFGRLKTKHVPEQDANTATTWDYNNDDTVHAVTDARGAGATYNYNNNRRLVSHISYEPAAGVPDTPDVGFEYDAVGNRTSMTDGLGSKSYNYNQLSQLMSETRTLNGVGTFTLSYDYNLAGELKKITDATNMTINYGYDSAGRLSGVTGSDNLVGGVSNYAFGFQYRAWGALKQMSAGPGHTASFGYDARLQANHFDISGGVVNQNYDRYSDGRLSFVHNTTDNNFDRAYTYDHAGRLTEAAAGGQARHDLGAVPMYETFAYNAWNNTTYRFSESWLNDFDDSGSYANGRRAGWGYDADGRIASIDTRTYSYDAAGQNISLAGQRWEANGYVPTSTTSDFDGDGNRIRETSGSSGSMSTTYYLRSSVLGGAIIEELNSSGQKQLGYVYSPGGSLLARQAPGADYVALKQVSPIGASQYEFFISSTMAEFVSRREFDPAGATVPLNNHSSFGHGGAAGDLPGGGGASDSRFGALENPGAGCTLDGVWVPCGMAYRSLGSGAAVVGPENTTRYNYTRKTFESFRAFADGYSGFLPTGGIYDGGGEWHILSGGKDNDLGKPRSVRPEDGNYGMYQQVAFLFGGEPQNPSPNVGDLESRITKIVGNPDCAKFISNLINGTASATNPAEFTDAITGFNLVKGQAGFIYGDTIQKYYGYRGGTVHGSISGKNAQVELPYPYANNIRNNPRMAAEFAEVQAREDALTVLHEILHLAGKNGYSDLAFANTVADMNRIARPDFSKLSGKDAVVAASKYWHGALRTACEPR